MNALILHTAGLHLLVASVHWLDNTSGGREVHLAVYRAGVLVSEALSLTAPTPNGFSVMQVTLQHIAEPGDVVQVLVKQTSGASLDVIADRTYLQIARLAQ